MPAGLFLVVAAIALILAWGFANGLAANWDALDGEERAGNAIIIGGLSLLAAAMATFAFSAA